MMAEICGDDLDQRLLSFMSTSLNEKDWDAFMPLLEKKENLQYLPRVIETIFGNLLDQLPCNSVEEKVLLYVLSFFEKMFYSNISNIVAKVQDQPSYLCCDVSSELNTLLQACLHLISGYSQLIDYIVKLGTTQLQFVKSLIKTLPSILLSSFAHCRDSEKSYRIYFSSSSHYLTTLFRKSYELSKRFYYCIDECIIPDFNIEDDLNIIVRAMEELFAVGEIVISLDFKAMVEQWKNLIKITSKYASYLKERLDISRPLKFLSTNLHDIIDAIQSQEKEEDEKAWARNLKLASFILKAIVKLCEMYQGYLNDCEDCLLNLLLLLYRCSRLNWKKGSLEIERFIVIGAAPLLSYLLKERSFQQHFNSYCINLNSLTSEQAVGFLFTHLRLMKFLVTSEDDEVKGCWFKIPLVSNVVNLFSMSFPKLDLNIEIEGSDIYTTLISITAAYMISCFSSESFVEVESQLLDYLFSPDIISGILVSDLLCLIGRLTNEEVCLNETQVICQIICNNNSMGIQSPESCVLGLTAARLFQLLSNNRQMIIVKEFQPQLQPYLWNYLNFELLPCHDIVEKVLSLSENQCCSALTYVNMVELLTLCNTSDDGVISKKLNNVVDRLWAGFETYPRSDIRQPDWWYYIFHLFMKFFCRLIKNMGDFFIAKVLNDFLELSALEQSSINYYLCIIMNDVPHVIAKKNDIVLSKIFNNCINSSNFLIKYTAIKSVVSFLETHKGNSLIKQLSSNPNIECYISNYYKKIPICNGVIVSFANTKFVHNCYCDDGSQNINNISENLDIPSLLDNLVKYVNLMKEFKNERKLTAEEYKTIKLIIDDLENL